LGSGAIIASMFTSVSAQGVWNARPPSPAAAWLGRNSRRGFSSTAATISLTEGDRSPDFYWVCDPTSFGFASGASHDPIASSPNFYEYCGDQPESYTDPSGLLSPGDRKALHKCARDELDALVKSHKISQEEANMRLAIIDAALNSKIEYKPREAGWRNPGYWVDKGAFQVKPGRSPCDAIRDMAVNGGGTGCTKACQVLILKGICDYCKSIGKEPDFDKVLRQSPDPTEFFEDPNCPFGTLKNYDAPRESSERFSEGNLMPGDQIHVNNPYWKKGNPPGLEGSNKLYVCKGKYIDPWGEAVFSLEGIQIAVRGYLGPDDAPLSRFPVDRWFQPRIPDVCKDSKK
jgi:hypothetical protein